MNWVIPVVVASVLPSFAFGQVRVLQVPIHPLHGQLIPRAISGDGRVVVGYGGGKAMVWVIDQGIEVCSSPVLGDNSVGSGISSDGSIVGGTTAVSTQTGFRWDRTSGAVSLLRDASGLRLYSVSAVSGDGLTIVGDVFQSGRNAAYWQLASGVTRLPAPPSGIATRMSSEVSYDGRQIVGSLLGGAPFAWNAEDGSFTVPVPSNLTLAYALNLTANGDAIFGMAHTLIPGTGEPFTWNSDTGATTLPSLPGLNTGISDVNADGRFAVGYGAEMSPSTYRVAAIHTFGSGMTTLGEYLRLQGANNPDSDFREAVAISDDGMAILGKGGIYPYWVVIMPPPQIADFNADTFVDFVDLADFLDCWEGTGPLPPSSADLNGDGFTDFFDLIEFIDNF